MSRVNKLTPQELATLSPELLAIYQSEAFGRLCSIRRRLATALTATMCTFYFGLLLIVAFLPRVVAIRVMPTTTLGIPLSFVVIVASVVLTAIYVRSANRTLDRLKNQALREVVE